MTTFYRFAKGICRFAQGIWFKVEVRGIENIPNDRGFILASNHRTYFDPLFVGTKLKVQLSFMAKEELFKNKLISAVLKGVGAFPVSRGSGDTSAIDKAVSTVKTGGVLAIFPEGTRSKTQELLRFKSGAIVVASQTGGDVVPTAVYNCNGLKFRSKVIVSYGEVIKNSDLGIDASSPSSIRSATNLVKDRVTQLFEDIKK